VPVAREDLECRRHERCSGTPFRTANSWHSDNLVLASGSTIAEGRERQQAASWGAGRVVVGVDEKLVGRQQGVHDSVDMRPPPRRFREIKGCMSSCADALWEVDALMYQCALSLMRQGCKELEIYRIMSDGERGAPAARGKPRESAQLLRDVVSGLASARSLVDF
jgi:hypothetical protein